MLLHFYTLGGTTRHKLYGLTIHKLSLHPQVWDTYSGTEIHSLEGHKNVVYAIAYNNPFGDKIVTGSFDKTCKLWHAETGELVSFSC